MRLSAARQAEGRSQRGQTRPRSNDLGELAAPNAAIEAERLWLEPVVVAHAELLIEDCQEPRLYRFMPGVRPPRLRELRSQFRRVQGGVRDEHGLSLAWAARARVERKYVGLFEVEISDGGRASLGYLIFSRFWRRGYGVEACQRIVRHLFEDHDVEVILIDTAVENMAARALAARLGFRVTEDEGSPTEDWGKGGLIRHTLVKGAPHDRE